MERNSDWNGNRQTYRPVIRGDLFYADLSPVKGSEQGGIRPVLVIQNDTGNRHSPTVIVAAITSRTTKAAIPTHVSLDKTLCGLKQDSTVLTEQIRTIDRSRLKEYIGHLDRRQMGGVDRAWQPAWGWNGISGLAEICLAVMRLWHKHNLKE